MGQSTDAILIYGVDFGEDPPWEPFNEFENEEELEASKLANPLGYLAFNGGHENEIMIESHCSGSAPMYIIGIKDSRHWAWRGNPVKVASTAVKPEWDALLAVFFAKHKITAPDTPAWLLASWWS